MRSPYRNKRPCYGAAPIGVVAISAANVGELCQLARDRGLSSTVVTSATTIPDGIKPLFFEPGRILMAEIEFATHLFVVAP